MAEIRGTYVVLLNWNGWRDTLACLESLLPDIARGARIVLCDNASTDGSLDRIESWARGEHTVTPTGHSRLDGLQQHRLRRPRIQRIARHDADRGLADTHAELILIENGANLGFAAGNNVGLRFALAQPDMTHVWLLNNDTLVEPDCLIHMRSRLDRCSQPAVCGSIIHFFDDPELIQCIGGNRFDRRRGRALESEGRFTHERELPQVHHIERSLDYLSGCSLLLPRSFLESVGLMNEDYFLYYEEVDWFTRADRRFTLLVERRAHLYHREGSSIGSRSWRRGPSVLSDRHMFRSRIRFMRRYYPDELWRCHLSNMMDVAKRLTKGQWRNAAAITQVMLRERSVPAPAP